MVLWKELKQGIFEPEFTNLQGKEWLVWNLTKAKGDWSLTFGLACWLLWNWRNKCCFEEGYSLPENRTRIVEWYVDEIKKARMEFGKVMGETREESIKWTAPRKAG